MTTAANAATVVLLGAGGVLPAAALEALRTAPAVYAAADLGEADLAALGIEPVPDPAALTTGRGAVLVAASAAESLAAELLAGGARLIGLPAGAGLLAAAAVMDRLRAPGGCPWDAEQTHDSLRQYLVEETYELLDAIEQRDRVALREELGDVLLQVLFHARVAAEDAADPFDVDAVATGLVDKLIGRHPHVFAGAERVGTAEHQEVKWEELKQAEKRRESIVDGVALGQPAAALAGKLGQRTGRAKLPEELFPAGDGPATQLFRLAALARRDGVDPEGELRAVARRFAADVRTAELAARAAGVDPSTLDAEGWRRFWPERDATAQANSD